MDTILNSQIFFFISSVGFVILFALLAVLLFYLIRAAKIFSRIAEGVEDDIDKIGDTTKEMFAEMKESVIFQFLFKKKKRSTKTK